MVGGERGGDLPSVNPERLCASFRAGNLKNIQRYMDPSKAKDAAPSPMRRLSVMIRQFCSSLDWEYGSSTFPDGSEAILEDGLL